MIAEPGLRTRLGSPFSPISIGYLVLAQRVDLLSEQKLAEVGERVVRQRLGEDVRGHALGRHVVHGDDVALHEVAHVGDPALKVLGAAVGSCVRIGSCVRCGSYTRRCRCTWSRSGVMHAERVSGR